MGICLDTEQSNESTTLEEGRDSWFQNSRRNSRNVVTPPGGELPMHNNTTVQFESPKVPVIFVLGGPGSGKVTHCDNLMQEKKGIVHINMTDLLQQYALGNDMQDFGLLSSKTVTEVLMLEMKMSPTAKTYLVSGYPRNMRDVVEYSEKIQTVNGAILISWRQKVLERQIDYGAKLGQVVLSLAKMELNNFYKNVMPVADYFDQSHLLIAINGERHPGDVYKDFKDSVIRILGMQDNPPILSSGAAPEMPNDVITELPSNPPTMTTTRPERLQQLPLAAPKSHEQPRNVRAITAMKPGRPPVLWVIGGPGSNKAGLCEEAATLTGWRHVSVGRLLRAAAEPPRGSGPPTGDVRVIRDAITAGEMVPFEIVLRLIESHMADNADAAGIIVDGYPREMEQVTEFEAKFKQKPTIILLDCSKLQLGRGRLDDSVTAFRRRLEIFRQASLPMLKAMDNIGRLTIVDGDTDTVPVREDFNAVVKQHINYIEQNEKAPFKPPSATLNAVRNGHLPHAIQNAREPIETISKRVHESVNGAVPNGIGHIGNGTAVRVANGDAPMVNGRLPSVKPSSRDRTRYSEIGHM